ncbi:flippase [Erysipelatoclostridium sp. An173]|uniref:flippase n=1 Tax=Erysipelatoclostridium sp. An173 TaxID=1965571 RepID=UPI000B36B61E|nr:flippase [Erysipelatoclostridium sp. An173]OUP73236.1 flippase [Erysipelatoclostridium sp. An173]
MDSIKKNFIYNSIYQIMIMFIPLITTPYISRVLGASGIGTYSYAYSIANYYVLFIMLGLNNYGNRSIAKVRDEKIELEKTFWSIYSMQFVLGIFFNIIYLLYCFIFSANSHVSLAVSFYVISACFDVNWFFFGLEKFKLTVIRNTIIKILTTICIFLFVKESTDIIIYCLIMTIGLLASQLALWPYILRNINFYKPTIKEIIVHIKPNLFLFLTVIAVSLFKIMDKVMLGIMTTTTEVGYYESAERIIAIPTALITSLGTVMLPRMTNMINNNKQDKKLIYWSMLFAMFISTSMCFGIMGVSKEFVPLFYGNGFEKCIDLFIILLPTCIFMAFANVIRTQYLLPHQMDKDYVISAFLGAGVNLTVNWIFIPLYGCMGAAIGTFFAEAIVCLYQAYAVRKYLPIKKYFYKSLYFIFAGLFMFLIIFNIDVGNMTIFVELFIKILIGIVLYFIVLILQILFRKYIIKKPIF